MTLLPALAAALLGATSPDAAAAPDAAAVSASTAPDLPLASASASPLASASVAASTAGGDVGSLRSSRPGLVRTPSASLPLLGLMLTGGVPDGGVLSLVVRPVKWVRVDGGVSYNALSFGAQGGLTLVPFHWGVVPTLRVEGGRFFKSDVREKVSRWAGDLPSYIQPALQGFGYDYASAQAGLEFGSQRRFVFFVRGGIAWVRGEFGDAYGVRDESSPGTEMDVKGLSVTATGPTASLGFLFYVW